MLFVVPRGLLCALRGFLFVSLLCPLLPCPHGSLYRIHNLLQTRRTRIPKLQNLLLTTHTLLLLLRMELSIRTCAQPQKNNRWRIMCDEQVRAPIP